MPNQFYCLAGYWIKKVDPRELQTFFFEKSKERINHYANIKEEVDDVFKTLISNINLYKIKVFFYKIKFIFLKKLIFRY